MARQLTMNLYVEHLKKQYVGAPKKEKARLLDELCELTGYHRKQTIALMSTEDAAVAQMISENG